jgi:anti-anti-sigma factor
MVTPLGHVRVRQREQTVSFRVEGRATMTQSFPMRRFAERCVASGTRIIRVDLRHCAYMDSTFLGSLLALRGAVTQREAGEMVLVSPSGPCSRLLEQMGILDMFTVVHEEEGATSDWVELPCDTGDLSSFKRNIVQAHEELAKVPGATGEEFRKVVQCMNEAEKTSRPNDGSPNKP